MKKLFKNNDISQGIKVGELRKCLEGIDDEMLVVMSFNGCDNNVRTISDVEITSRREIFETGGSSDWDKQKILHLYSNRLHFE